jgi:hypothetical protein
MGGIDRLTKSLQKLTRAEIQALLDQRQAENAALRTLLRAAMAREREQRKREAGRAR